MEEILVEEVYNSLCGHLIPEARVPGVEDAFSEGSPCALRYAEAMAAYARLRQRLGISDEDTDVECIINALLDNTRELCLRMYFYGAALK